MRAPLICVLALLVTSSMYGQNLIRAEYFFDTDPGHGAATPIAIANLATVSYSFTVPSTGLTPGFHTLHYRVQQQDGKWSHTVSRTFIVLEVLLQTPSSAVTRAEYFVDDDPGVGNGTAFTVTPGASINPTVVYDVSALSPGFHTFNARVQDNLGRWSHAAIRTFYVLDGATFPVSSSIRRAEYFFDNDPGTGNGTAFTVAATASITPNPVVDVTSLTPGFHTFNFRVQDNLGRWSHAASRTFYKLESPAAAATSLVRAEYFFNTDPGVGNATPLTFTAGAQIDQNLVIDLSASNLTEGFHELIIRMQDNTGRWSHSQRRTFYVLPGTVVTKNLTRLEYFVDVNPDINPSAAGTALTITPVASVNQDFIINITGIPSGEHFLYVRAKDNEGFYSNVVRDTFNITACTPPPLPSASDQSRCSAGSVVLTASGGTASQQYRWYTQALGGSPVFTGASFTTPSLTANTDYFVSIYDPSTLCEGDRRRVTANIIQLAKPVVNPSGEITFCEGNAVFLTAPSGFAEYRWSNGSATRQVVVTQSGKYAVQVGANGCLSPASDSVVVNAIPLPSKPTITISGSTTICGAGTVELRGPDGFTYQWSNGATTQAITVTQTGAFFLRVLSSGSCLSAASETVVVTFLPEPCGPVSSNNPPVIDNKPFASRIEGTVNVDLTKIISDPDNNVDFATLRVVNGVTARGANASIDNNYFLNISYTGKPFTGVDRVTLEVCDLSGACVQEVIDIDVVGEVVVYNGISPDGDGYNDFLLIRYIEAIEGALDNKVTIYNRWGDVVFQVNGYNNTDKIFRGVDKNGNELPGGTYFYTIEMKNRKAINGYLTLLR